MRIALLHPTFVPEVRRAGERQALELATGLCARGHEVTVLTSHSGAGRTDVIDGVTVSRARRPPYMRPLRWYEDNISGAPSTMMRLRKGGFDVAHALTSTDAWAAVQAHKRGFGPPVVASLPQMPTRPWLVERRYRMQMLASVVAEAAVVTVPSAASADCLRRYLMHEPEVVPGGVRLEAFAGEVDRSEAPSVLCAASLVDPQRRGELLLEAFALLRADLPAAELVLVRPNDPLTRSWEAPSRPEGVRWAEAADDAGLAGLYRSVSASVLPAESEAFGLAAVESLAAGTPVAAARSGGLPEVVSDDSTGRLFTSGDAKDLARAMAETIDLGADAATAGRCREVAAGFTISRTLDAFESLHDRARASS